MKKLLILPFLAAACAKDPNMAEILFKEDLPQASCYEYAPVGHKSTTQVVLCSVPATDGSEPVEVIVYKAPGRRLGYATYLTPAQEQRRKEAEAKKTPAAVTPPPAPEGQGSGAGAEKK